MECYLNWTILYQMAKQEWEYQLMHEDTVTHYAQYILQKWREHEVTNLMAFCFREMALAARDEKHARVKYERQEVDTWIEQMQLQADQKEEQLQDVYQQVDKITKTLETELRTKEELANELREANNQMRQATFSTGAFDGTFNPAQEMSISQLSSPAGPAGETTEMRSMRRVQSEGTLKPAKKAGPRGKTSAIPALPGGGGHSTSTTLSGSLGKRSWLDGGTAREGSPGSPQSRASCDWDTAIPRMRDQGLFRRGEAPRL